MRVHEFGDKTSPSVVLIHGGGNAWWNYLRQARILAEKYHVILPTLDGHGEEYQKEYVSTEVSAQQIMKYINKNCGGRVFALGGVSLGGQIAIELMSLKSDIADKAVLDGCLCMPQPTLARISAAIVKRLGKLMFCRPACKMQLSLMKKMYPDMAYPEEIENAYMTDLPRMRIKTLETMYRTYMGEYCLKSAISESKTQVLFVYGEKEMRCVKESAVLFQKRHPDCMLYEAKGYHHGELSVYRPLEWAALVRPFLERNAR